MDGRHILLKGFIQHFNWIVKKNWLLQYLHRVSCVMLMLTTINVYEHTSQMTKTTLMMYHFQIKICFTCKQTRIQA